MADPFFLKCECGGELAFPGLREIQMYSYVICPACERKRSALEEVQRYAAAFGVAVEALEMIIEEGDVDCIERIAQTALKQIRGGKEEA